MISSVAARDPSAAGLNTTGMLVLPPLAATVIGEPAVGAVKADANPKSPALLPLNPIPVICRGALPVFVMVNGRDALVVPTAWPANVRLAGFRPKFGVLAPPTPLKVMKCAGPPLLSLMISAALRVP